MTRTWSTAQGLTITERTCCLRDGVLAAEVTVENRSSDKRTLTLALWTIQFSDGLEVDAETEIDRLLWADGTIDISRRVGVMRRGKQVGGLFYQPCLHGDRRISRITIRLSQHNSYAPEWRLTPFYNAMPSEDDNPYWASHSGGRLSRIA